VLLALLLVAGCGRGEDRGRPPPGPPGEQGAAGDAAENEPAVATPGLDPEAAVATVGEEVIRVGDLAPGIAMRIYEIQVDLHSLLTREAERLAAERLWARAARERGMEAPALVAAEVDARVVPPTEAEVDAWLAEHPAGAGDREFLRARARTYLTERRRAERRQAVERELRQAHPVKLLLRPPKRPRVEVDLQGAPVRGPADAPVTVVLFGALGQRATVEAVAMTRRLEEERPGQTRFAFRHFLSSGDEASLGAAMLGRHAAEAGRFWPLFDALVALRGSLDEDRVRAAARSAGIDLEAFAAERRAGRWLAPLRQEIALGRRLGLDEPPALFVDGRYVHPSFGFERLLAVVDEAAAGGGARD